MMVRLALMMACAKGAQGIGGLMEALHESGNPQLISDFQALVKESYGVETECNFDEPKGVEAAAPTRKSGILSAKIRSDSETSSCGSKVVDKIMSRVEFDFMGHLECHLVGKASKIVNIPQFCSSLVGQKVLDEADLRMTTGPEVQDRQQIEKAIKAACSKRAIGSLVVALQNSNNEEILLETYGWLETSQGRQKNYPISLKSLARERGPTATGLFAATVTGLISLDLQTLKATPLTSIKTYAVAVNHKLKKVYWTQGGGNCSIMRSNFDATNKEVIIPPAGDDIYALAIEETSGNVYFALYNSHEIKVCNELGGNCAAVISYSFLVNHPVSIALDSLKGFMYWGNRLSHSNSLVRANLDGSNATIISTGFKNLYGITVGQPSNDVLYWEDWLARTIGTIDVNGGNKRTLVELESNSGLWGIQSVDNKIYFSTGAYKTILSVDRVSGKDLTTIFKSTGKLHQIALFNTPAKHPLTFE